tara:strand:+ start:1518 stop:1790 length:273 start_codon:yes stop_codon:yes gene_type:complete
MGQLQFFLGEFHAGAVNQALHFIGFAILGYGVAMENFWLVVVSGALMFAGNLFNYIRGRYKKEFWQTVPFQLGGWVLFVALAYLIDSLLK